MLKRCKGGGGEAWPPRSSLDRWQRSCGCTSAMSWAPRRGTSVLLILYIYFPVCDEPPCSSLRLLLPMDSDGMVRRPVFFQLHFFNCIVRAPAAAPVVWLACLAEAGFPYDSH